MSDVAQNVHTVSVGLLQKGAMFVASSISKHLGYSLKRGSLKEADAAKDEMIAFYELVQDIRRQEIAAESTADVKKDVEKDSKEKND